MLNGETVWNEKSWNLKCPIKWYCRMYQYRSDIPMHMHTYRFSFPGTMYCSMRCLHAPWIENPPVFIDWKIILNSLSGLTFLLSSVFGETVLKHHGSRATCLIRE